MREYSTGGLNFPSPKNLYHTICVVQRLSLLRGTPYTRMLAGSEMKTNKTLTHSDIWWAIRSHVGLNHLVQSICARIALRSISVAHSQLEQLYFCLNRSISLGQILLHSKSVLRLANVSAGVKIYLAQIRLSQLRFFP